MPDRNIVHVMLWDRRRRATNTVTVNQTRFADELGVNRFTVCRLFADMVAEGRMRSISPGSRVNTYKVVDPDLWQPEPLRDGTGDGMLPTPI